MSNHKEGEDAMAAMREFGRIDGENKQLRARIAELEAQQREDGEHILKLIADIRYIAGIAERGRGYPLADGERITNAVLGYVKQLEAQQRAGVPEGWKLVPVEPTKEMKIAGDHAGWWCADKYRAMLAAAPAPKAQEHVPVDHETTAKIDAAVAAGRIVMPQPAEVGADDAYSLAHEIWATAQLGPHDSIADAVDRIAALLARAQLTEGAAILERAWYHKMEDGDYELFSDKDATCGECIEVAIVPVTALTAAGGREDVDWPQQVFELCNFLAGQGWTMTKATHEAWMLSTGDANKYPNPLEALARMALAASQPTQEKPE